MNQHCLFHTAQDELPWRVRRLKWRRWKSRTVYRCKNVLCVMKTLARIAFDKQGTVCLSDLLSPTGERSVRTARLVRDQSFWRFLLCWRALLLCQITGELSAEHICCFSSFTLPFFFFLRLSCLFCQSENWNINTTRTRLWFKKKTTTTNQHEKIKKLPKLSIRFKSIHQILHLFGKPWARAPTTADTV